MLLVSYIVNSASLSGIGTEAPVFAAGDCRRGASLIVTALAEGRDVAAVIDRLGLLVVMREAVGSIPGGFSYLTSASHQGFSSVLPRCVPLSANPALYRGPNWSSLHSSKAVSSAALGRRPISSLRRAGSISK